MTNLERYQNVIKDGLSELSLPKEPANLYDPLRYFLELGGKRLRPVLVLLGYELYADDIEKAKKAAMSVELFHNFTLIHDDVMDEAPLRRGKETVHTKWNQSIAILSGDALLIEAYKCLGSYEPELQAKLLTEFNQMALEVCEGQQYDLDFEDEMNVSIDQYIDMIRRKTAVLLGCSFRMGGTVAGCSDKDAQDLYNFGVNLGIAFQLQDDILDTFGTEEQVGKQIGGDIMANKKTYLLIKALEDATEDQQNRIVGLFDENNADLKVSKMKEIFGELDIYNKAVSRMNDFHHKAMESLDVINVPDEKKNNLRELADFLLAREF